MSRDAASLADEGELRMSPRSVSELAALHERGEQPDLLLFWGHTPRGDGVGPWVLSQWWPVVFTLDGVAHRSAEHAMMAGKAELFGDPATRDRILAAATPRDAKALGRQVRGYDDDVWAAARFDLVVRVNVAKFAAEPLRGYLLGTGDDVLVEAAPDDAVWGIGVAADDHRARQPAQWPGTNLLGFALMEARGRLRAGTA